jgi:hypothetical protein
MSRRARAALVAAALGLVLLLALPLGCALRKRDYIDDNLAILNAVPAYPGALEKYTNEASEYRNGDNELAPPTGWSSHRVYFVPRGVRMRQVLAFYDTELTRRGWRKQHPDCGAGAYEKDDAAILVNAGGVNPRDPTSDVDVGVDAHGADEC